MSPVFGYLEKRAIVGEHLILGKDFRCRKKALTAVCACVRFQLQHPPKKDLILTPFFKKKTRCQESASGKVYSSFVLGKRNLLMLLSYETYSGRSFQRYFKSIRVGNSHGRELSQ